MSLAQLIHKLLKKRALMARNCYSAELLLQKTMTLQTTLAALRHDAQRHSTVAVPALLLWYVEMVADYNTARSDCCSRRPLVPNNPPARMLELRLL
jgi:hypothetical protein